MRQDTAKILDEWATVLKFNPNQKSFNLGNYSLDIHIAGESMKKFIDKFDHSGELSVLYAKHFYLDYLKHVSINLLDLFTNDSVDDISIFRNLYWDMLGHDVKVIEAKWVEAVAKILNRLGIYLIADKFDTSALYDSVDCIVNDITKCNVDVFGKGPRSKDNEPFIYSTTILVFNTLADCILNISSSTNGIYLCYISLDGKPDGYFTYIYKCENTLISINDRVKESFRGQHNRSRNNRWMEYKCYNLFPYNIIDYGDERDYKGYATSMKLCEDVSLSLGDQGIDAAKIIITMMMIENFVKYKIDFSEYELSYSDMLLPVNRSKLFDSKDTELMVVKGNEIAEIHESVDFNISRNDVVFGLNDDDEIISTSAYSDFKDSKEAGDGIYEIVPDFEFDASTLLAVTDKNQAEFIGTYSKMREQAYMDARDKYSKYCRQKIAEDYLKFGGMKAIENWFYDTCKHHVNDIKNAAVRKYVSGTGNGFDYCTQVIDHDFMYSIRVDFDDYGPTADLAFANTEYKNGQDIWTCPVTGNVANVWVKFKIRSANDLKELLGIETSELPRILQKFKSDRDYKVNNLLSTHDPLSVVGSPIEDHMWKSDEMEEARKDLNESQYQCHTLTCCIGFSKRGLNKLVKNPSIVITYNDEGKLIAKED